MSLGKVFVVGGIHGNEMSGVYAIKNWLSEGLASTSTATLPTASPPSAAPPSLQRYAFLRARF